MKLVTPYANPEAAVLATMSYFDAVDIALTTTEVFWWSFRSEKPFTLQESEQAITSLADKHMCELHGAYVTLPGRVALIEQRVSRGMLSFTKFERARSAVRLLRFVPFIKMVGVCNTLALSMARKEGDIDLFIVTKKRLLFFVRALTTFLFHVTRFRRHGFHIANRMCLSFYVDEAGLDMSRFALPESDPYLAVWTKSMIPVFSVNKTYETFCAVNSIFVLRHMQCADPVEPIAIRRVTDSWISRAVRTLLEWGLYPLGHLLNTPLLRAQLRRKEISARSHVRLHPSGVVVDAHTMKFHEEDRRQFFKDRMHDRCVT